MKKIFLVLAFAGMVGGVSATTVSSLTNSNVIAFVKEGDDKDKKKKSEKSCCKKTDDKKACANEGSKAGAKSCCKKDAKTTETAVK